VRNIYALGETVLDILFRDKEPFTAKAGGAVLNSALTLGRLGFPIHFITEYGLDEVGKFIDDFLSENNVNTQHVYRHYDGKSSLALAFLNPNKDASYDFYKIDPKQHLNIKFPEVKKDDIILFGSIFAINRAVRSNFIDFIKYVRKQKAIIIYDPNFRKQHLHDLKKLKPMIEENISLSHIVRGSNEDFALIFGTSDAAETYEVIKDKCDILLYTANKKGIYLNTPTIDARFPVKAIDPVSTIGAGDNFNAGIITRLLTNHITLKKLHSISPGEWENIISTAVSFATHVCLRYDNYISKEFAKDFRTENKL
jgi:fructokinase